MQIEIVNWSKYNPRNDVGHSSWFRLENNFWFDPAISLLDNCGKLTWIYLLSNAGLQRSYRVAIDFQMVCAITRARKRKVVSILEQLETTGKIKIVRNADVTPTLRARDADGPLRTNVRTKHISDAPSVTSASEQISPSVTKRKRKPKAEPIGGPSVWEAYASAYLGRYGRSPVRNVKTNSQCKQLVERLGLDAACAVIKFYVSHNDAFYVRKLHPIGLCLQDCEGIHTQMLTGRNITGATAHVKDRQQANIEAAKEAMRILEFKDGQV